MVPGVFGKRHKPELNQIERVINKTHSVIWGCPICYPGQGLSVKCGTSVPFNRSIECLQCVEGVTYSDKESTGVCLACRVCGENQVKTGVCSLEKDDTDCKCIEDFYREITGDCHECGWCCVNDSRDEYMPDCTGMPKNKRCRIQKHSDECVPQKTTVLTLPMKIFAHGPKLSQAQIASIGVGVFLTIIAVLALCVLWRREDLRQRVQNFFWRNCCCPKTMNFQDEGPSSQDDVEKANCKVEVARSVQNPPPSTHLLKGADEAVVLQFEVNANTTGINSGTTCSSRPEIEGMRENVPLC